MVRRRIRHFGSHDVSRSNFLHLAIEFLGHVYQAIIAGEPWAVQFRLRTKGKGRGYVERVEQDIRGKDGGPVQFQVFDHTAATAAIARRSSGNRNASGADENDSDGA